MNPAKITRKLASSYPTILLDKSKFYVLFGQTITATCERNDPISALVLYVGSYYIFDIEYPRAALLELTVYCSQYYLRTVLPLQKILDQFDHYVKDLAAWRD